MATVITVDCLWAVVTVDCGYFLWWTGVGYCGLSWPWTVVTVDCLWWTDCGLWWTVVGYCVLSVELWTQLVWLLWTVCGLQLLWSVVRED